MKRSCNNTSLASIARIKSLSYFYPFRQRIPFLKELKQKAKTESQIGQKLPKMQPRGLKINKFFGEPHIPQGVPPPPSHTYPDLALHAKMAAPHPFLVLAIATIVLAISNLNKNPECSSVYGLFAGVTVL